MKELKKEEISWEKISLVKAGSEGLKWKYSHLVDINDGKRYLFNVNTSGDIIPNDDLIKEIHALKAIVSKVEEYDSVRELKSTAGFEPTKIQIQMIEAKAQESMKKIEVTGIELSEKKEGFGAIILYEKLDKNEETTSKKTAWICYEGKGDVAPEYYGIEDDLSDTVEAIKNEAYLYITFEKFADSDQMTINYAEVEDAETLD